MSKVARWSSLLEHHFKSEHVIVCPYCMHYSSWHSYTSEWHGLVTTVCPRRGNRISRHREWIIIGRRYFLASPGCSCGSRICIHIYNETRSRLNSSTFVAHILWSAHVASVTGRQSTLRHPISDDRYIIFCTLRAFCGNLGPSVSSHRAVSPFSSSKNADATKSRTWLNERTVFRRIARLYIRLCSVISLSQIRLCNSRCTFHPDRALWARYVRNLHASELALDRSRLEIITLIRFATALERFSFPVCLADNRSQ